MPYKDKKKMAEYHKRWYAENREESLKKHKIYYSSIRSKVFSFYCKGDPKCECCGETIMEFLSIDHIDGGGTQHRKKIGLGYIYFWIIKNNFPDGFRVLCHNCNQAMGLYGKCPHNKLK